jgi:hypothetical protein
MGELREKKKKKKLSSGRCCWCVKHAVEYRTRA